MLIVDLESVVPLEEQIRQGIREAIARSDLAPGQELPSVRQLAGDLGIHWNTVARAYRRLRDEGLLAVGRGRRVTVRDRPDRSAEEKRKARELIRVRCREALTEARLAGLSLEEVRELLGREMKRWVQEVRR